jgi:DDE superfamily endonuclease/Protein of unknown function (DUF3631)
MLTRLDTAAMNLFLAELSQAIAPGARGVVLMDKAGWHTAGDLVVPDNLSLVFLPPYSPELNPIEGLWLHLRDNRLTHRVFHTTEDIDVDDAIAIQLLADLRDLFDPLPTALNPDAQPVDKLVTTEILKALHDRDDRPWSEYSRLCKPISGAQIAALLRPLGVSTNNTIRRGLDGPDKGYERRHFDDAFERYLPAREDEVAFCALSER